MDLVVNHWQEHAPLANLRKNVRLIVVPIVNPWDLQIKNVKTQIMSI